MPFKTSGECIQNMKEFESQPIFIPDRYVSKYKLQVALELKTSRDSSRTMGRAQELLPEPSQFLKKHTRKVASAPPTRGDHRCLLSERRPDIPKPTNIVKSNEERGRTTSRNFLKENVRRAIKSAPPRVRPKFVDSHRGSIQVVENSGLKPRYVLKKNFGNVPHWLQKIDKEKSSENEKSEDSDNNKFSKLSDDERAQILKGLKISLNEKNHDFLLLPVIIDTPYLINYKSKLEKIIKQLEKDIQNIDSHAVIYICN